MMRLPVVLLGLGLAATDVHADPISIIRHREVERGDANEAPPLLRFESSLKVDFESFDEQTIDVVLAPHAKLDLTATWRSVPEWRVRDNDLVRWWRAGITGSYDLGWARVSAHGTYEHNENELGRASSFDVGLGLTRTVRLSRDMLAFFSLSLGRRQWLGRPLPGEFNASQLRLAMGIRWR